MVKTASKSIEYSLRYGQILQIFQCGKISHIIGVSHIMGNLFPSVGNFYSIIIFLFSKSGENFPEMKEIFPHFRNWFSDKRIFVSQNVGIFPRCGNRFPSFKYIIFPPKFPAFLGYSLVDIFFRKIFIREKSKKLEKFLIIRKVFLKPLNS